MISDSAIVLRKQLEKKQLKGLLAFSEKMLSNRTDSEFSNYKERVSVAF